MITWFHLEHLYLLTTLLIVFVVPASPASNNTNITVGFMAPWTGSWPEAPRFASAISIAVDDINANSTILKDYNLKWKFLDERCSGEGGAGATADLIYTSNVDIFIGPACSAACLTAGLVAAYFKKPMISYGCSSMDLSDNKKYPDFFRTKPFARGSKTVTPKGIVGTLNRFKWKYACIAEEIDEVFTPLTMETSKVFSEANFTIGAQERFYLDTLDAAAVLRKLKPICRIIVLLTSRIAAAQLMIGAKSLQMLNGEFVFITVDLEFSSKWDTYPWSVGHRPVKEIFNGTLDVKVVKVSMRDSQFADFNKEVTKRLAFPPWNYNLTRTVISSAAYLYDAVWLYAIALNRSIEKGVSLTNRSAISSQMTKTEFEGITGKVVLDVNGDRMPIFQFSNVHASKIITMATFDPATGKVTHIRNDYVFPGGVTTVPRDVPVCGFYGELCIKGPEDGSSLLALICVPFVLILIVLVAVYLYKKKKYEKEMLEKGLIVNFQDIQFIAKTNSMLSRCTTQSFALSKASLATDGGGEMGVGLALYKSERVFVKKLLSQNSTVGNNQRLAKDLLMDLRKLKELNHANINQFVGVSLNGPDTYVISQFAAKGSLQDILQNDDIELDWMFKLSFAADIAKGMIEVQRNLGCHGKLTSSNCVIDSRWVCKVTDCGLDKLFAGRVRSAEDPYIRSKRLLWTAPEFLSKNATASKSKSGDVYSYGIILQEICTRTDPYGNTSFTPQEIIHKVCVRSIPAFRPPTPSATGAPEQLLTLMHRCWDDYPDNRPSFKEIFKIVKSFNKLKKGGSLVDQMILMMEKYTNNLEELVGERTQQLEEEKAKTDELLYKMLPKSVANELKCGKPVNAKHYDQVTIFFSDIVGFTSLAGESTPLQVVDFLNDLYSLFDTTIEPYDVYKVETIGDAYMVVSGLPVPNGNRHAGEIATMSLDLLHAVKSFHIRHKPGKQLQLRIGIHSGPCVAGVVGLKMPRYCLFGDTVNYASRMESSGLALRVHVSPECRAALEVLGGYHLKERGPVTMKGKGTIITYFLEGKDGYNKSLPDIRMAASLSEHCFK